MKYLDFQTASVIYTSGNFCIAALLAVAFSDSRAKGARLWIVGLISQVTAAPLFALRGAIPDSLSIVLANGLFALSWTCYLASFDVFFGNPRPRRLYVLPVLISVALGVGLLDDVKPRAVLLAALYAGQTWMIAALVLGRFKAFRQRVILMLTLGYALASLSFLVRAFAVISSPEAVPDPFAPGMLQNVAMLLSVPSLVACTLGFVLLHRERAEGEVRRLADIDYLTGLQNRRGFEAHFTRELREAGEQGGWTSLALIDIDYFKAVNDRHGHAVGDKALVEMAHLISRELRGGDGAARIGGDEFCVLLSQAAPSAAERVAERLRRAVADHDWRAVGLDAPLTVTIGLSSHQGGSRDAGADVMRLADMALLAAKGMARDMVLHADELSCQSRAKA